MRRSGRGVPGCSAKGDDYGENDPTAAEKISVQRRAAKPRDFQIHPRRESEENRRPEQAKLFQSPDSLDRRAKKFCK